MPVSWMWTLCSGMVGSTWMGVALQNSGKMIPWQVERPVDGKILDR